MGNSLCQCNTYISQNIYGIMKKSDIAFSDNNKKNNINKPLKVDEQKNQDYNSYTNSCINHDNNKRRESYDMVSKMNKSSKNNINKSPKNDISVNNENEEEGEEDDEEKEEEQKEESSREERKKNLIEVFDNLMISYADYITETKYEKSILPEFVEMEKNLKPITKDNEKIKEFINDKILERPPLKFLSNEFIYKGMWNINGEKEGFGTLIDKEGNKYTGGWKEDKCHGYGRLLSKNGDYYEGEWANGVIEGYGTFYSKQENYIYIGYFENFKFNGKGKIIYDKSTYEGNFVSGYKEGKGQLIFEDGSFYIGNFHKNNYNGNGIFKWNDGKAYSGEWKNNVIEGEGKFIWSENVYYKGEYKNNAREGKGTYYFGEKDNFTGIWKNNLPHGEGVLTYKNQKIKGEFRFGKLIKEKSEDKEISSQKKSRKGHKKESHKDNSPKKVNNNKKH